MGYRAFNLKAVRLASRLGGVIEFPSLWVKLNEPINRASDAGPAFTVSYRAAGAFLPGAGAGDERVWRPLIKMLPRSARLRRSGEIQRVLQEGRCLTTPYVRICLHPSPTARTRVACVVGKSVHRSAVRRHKYQRWLREIARHFLAAEAPNEAYDMVWVARPGMVEMASVAAVEADLKPRWQKLWTPPLS